VKAQILDTWPRLPGGALDLRAAPFRLLAVVDRLDLRNLADGDAGEGRFVFGFLDGGLPTEATLIIEYKLPAATSADVLRWAQAFHALGALPFSEEYNVALEALTESFTRRGARPSHPNGSALGDVRTNELAFGEDGNWELREFALSPTTGRLEPRPVELTPDLGLNGGDALARFVNANAAAILLDEDTVPDVFEGRPFRAGASLNDASVWAAAGIADNEARHHLALNTCNGCHGSETKTDFLHVRPRLAGFESRLSPFLTGKMVPDPVTQEPRTFNELARRRADLEAIVCPP
jgi:cytochrome c553